MKWKEIREKNKKYRRRKKKQNGHDEKEKKRQHKKWTQDKKGKKTDGNSTNLISCRSGQVLVVHLRTVGQFTIVVVGVDDSQDIKWIPYVFLIKTLAPNKYYVTLETQFRPDTPPTSKSEMIHQRRWFALIDSQFSSSSNTHSPRMYFSLFSLFIDRKVSQITLILIGSLFFIISRLCFSMQTLDFKVHKLVHSAVRVHTGITVHMYVCQTKFNWSSTHTYS